MADDGQFDELSYKEKLRYVNAELYLIQQRCINNNQNELQISKAAKAFQIALTTQRKTKLPFLFKFSVFVGVVSLLIYSDIVSTVVWTSTRLLVVKILPIWSWRQLYAVQCFLSNPLLNNTEIFPTSEDCKVCENLRSIPVLLTTSTEEVAQKYIGENVPVIVSGGSEHQQNNFMPITMPDLYKLYSEDEVLKLYFACEFTSNVHVNNSNHRTFLQMVHEEQVTQYHAQWQNCFKEPAKVIRRLYRRPEYVPSTVELADCNWIFVSNDVKLEQKLLPVPIHSDFSMLVQLAGELTITLQPVDACSTLCNNISATLHAGYVLLATDFLYRAFYTPSSSQESITVGVGGSYDF